eukprot:8050384-Alexandrium_andersonii.AAC.1
MPNTPSVTNRTGHSRQAWATGCQPHAWSLQCPCCVQDAMQGLFKRLRRPSLGSQAAAGRTAKGPRHTR